MLGGFLKPHTKGEETQTRENGPCSTQGKENACVNGDFPEHLCSSPGLNLPEA